ncbi:MAG TPA: NAD kinase [Spirochaetota bacterium]
MRIALIGISYSDTSREPLQALITSLRAAGDTLYIYTLFHEFISSEIDYTGDVHLFSEYNQIASSIDCIVSIGGDGTFLHAVQFARDSGVPILGINTGRLGYLTCASITESIAAVDRVRKGDYTIEKRSLLRVDSSENLFGGNNFALNDFTIHKKDSASMITIHAHVNGVFLNSYWGDGLIISTPTGSTAYSLSCGGPIVAGECGVFVITPISPHNLNVRPIVVPESSSITLIAETRHQYYLAALDSRSESVDHPIEFTIQRESFAINIVRFPETGFAATIRGKLFWGLDRRN